MKPKITIGLAAYNGEKTINQSIESLLRQSYENFTLVISDDASVDGTWAVVERHCTRDSRVKGIRRNTNVGPLENFRAMLEEADSDFFMWASQDDLWSRNYLFESVAALSSNPDRSFTIPHWICESRTFPLLRRFWLPSFRFLEAQDSCERILSFTVLPFSSFKDNITYGLYRTDHLRDSTLALENKVKYFSIGGVHNEFNVFTMRGICTTNCRLHKRYKYLPPGHFLSPLMSAISSYKDMFTITDRKPLYPRYTDHDYLTDLEVVLRTASVDSNTYDRVMAINKDKISRKKL